MLTPAQQHTQKIADILHSISSRITRLEAAGDLDEQPDAEHDYTSEADTLPAPPDFAHDRAEELQMALSNRFPAGVWKQENGMAMYVDDVKILTIKPNDGLLTVAWVMPPSSVRWEEYKPIAVKWDQYRSLIPKWESYRFGTTILRTGQGEVYHVNRFGVSGCYHEFGIVETVITRLNVVWSDLWQ